MRMLERAIHRLQKKRLEVGGKIIHACRFLDHLPKPVDLVARQQSGTVGRGERLRE